MISALHKGSTQDRHRLAVYCVRDAYLPLQLMSKMLSIIMAIELARVCKVPFKYLLTRDQQIRVFSQLMSKANERGMIIPAIRGSQADAQYQGATRVDPRAGYYRTPILTLTFASLYPSIMIAHNLCYSTLIRADDLSDVEFELPPNHIRFVKTEVFPGVLPDILKELVRAQMACERDPWTKRVLNCRQLAIKISANSFYGFTGATLGKLLCLAVSETVMAYGRMMIDETKRIVEEKYRRENGYKDNAVVIYRDTNSVMVSFGDITLAEAIAIGKEAADFVSLSFPSLIHLEFKKAYRPSLLVSKKQFAGLNHMSVGG
jgi:DNA polymerase delta subunit 1